MASFNPTSGRFLDGLAAIVGPDRLSTAEAERRLRSQDMSRFSPRLSDVVVWPESADKVARILKLASDARVPVTPWGAGSSLEGNPIPLYGGVCLAMERMNGIVAVHTEDFQVTVQPGLGYKDLNEALGPHGLFFAPDPGANASIGGMLANNAAGSRTVKYGATRDNVLALEVALADGRLIRVGSRAVKQSAGYDLVHLFVGSEGTLGVITEATLKLVPIPTIMSGVLATFPDVRSAIAAVVEVRASGLDVAALEFMDAATAALLTRVAGVNWGDRPALLMEIHAAHEAAAALDLAVVRDICDALGARRFEATSDPSERQAMWTARHHMYETKRRAFPGDRWLLMDIAVPIGALPDMVAFITRTLADMEVYGFTIGHAGDGNLHVEMPYHEDATLQRALRANDAIVVHAIELGGTCTGEHGVGIGKAKFLRRELGEAVDVMRTLKRALDPAGILNPGKVLAAEA